MTMPGPCVAEEGYNCRCFLWPVRCRGKEKEYSMKTTDISFQRNGYHLHAQLLLPEDGQGPYPAVILSHGFNGSGDHGIPYAEAFVRAGMAGVVFDFIGGSMDSKSGGHMTQMSVQTELADLLDVLEHVKALPQIDEQRIWLFGRSQGGLVSAMAAAQCPETVKGLILLYPAFNLPDMIRNGWPDPAQVPEETEILGAVVGRKYYDDLISLDPAELQRAYGGPVLIIQGQKDTTVPPQTAEDAARRYAQCTLLRLPEAQHGFAGADLTRAEEASVQFIMPYISA